MNDQTNVNVGYVTPLKRICMTIGELPASYLETMTYYEMLLWFTKYLKETLIPTINNNAEAVTELQNLYEELRTYVNNYFDDLDVQEEINNKLDEMTANGTLTALIKAYVDPIYQAYEDTINSEISAQNTEISTFKSQINSSVNTLDLKIDAATSGAPIPVSSTSSMTDTTKIYVNTTDGKWYYYNGTNWTIGGTYQGTSLNDTDASTLVSLQQRVGNIDGNKYFNNFEIGTIYISNSGWEYALNSKRIRTPEGTTIHLSKGDIIGLTDYSNYRFFIGWKDANNVYGVINGWQTADLEISYEADYVITIAYLNDNTDPLTSASQLSRLFKLQYTNNIPYLQNQLLDLDYYNTDVTRFRKMIDSSGPDVTFLTKFAYSGNRRSIKHPIMLPYQMEVSVPNGYSIAYQTWSSDNTATGTKLADSGWLGATAVTPKNAYFCLVFKEDGNTNLSNSFDETVNFRKIKDIDEIIPYYNYYDTTVKGVNHRGYNTIAPEETAPAYKLSKENGFDIVECDIRLTSDNHVVLLHDSTVNRTSNGTGEIHDMTLAQAKLLDFGSWKSSAYTGTRILTLEEFITLCRNINLHAYIEIEPDAGFNQSLINSTVDIVKNAGMLRKVSWISFSTTMLSYVLNADPSARCGFLSSAGDLSTLKYYYNIIKRPTNEAFVDYNYENLTTEIIAGLQEVNIPLEVWTVDNETVLNNLDPYVTGVTSDNLVAEQVLYNSNID